MFRPDVARTKGFVILIVLLFLAHGGGFVSAADLGSVREEAQLDIVYSAIRSILDAPFDHPDAVALFSLGEQAFTLLDPDVFTGYSVKNEAQAAGYRDDLTVRYGHADAWHLIELLVLLRHYGFDARLSVESRVSSYVHHYEWGTPEPGVKVVPIDEDRAYIYVMEYDALFEFATPGEATAFDEFLRTYAQKVHGEEHRHDVVRGSWYVPLYSSTSARDGYRPLKEIRVRHGDHYLVNYVLPEHVDTIVDGLQSHSGPGYSVAVKDIWVNESFFDYVAGASE